MGEMQKMNKRIQILIVDSNPTLLQTTSLLLRSANYEVIETSSGYECLRIAKETKPDLILLDGELLDMDSMEVGNRIKADPELVSIFIVYLFARPISISKPVMDLKASADSYIIRPIYNEEFLIRVQEIFRIKKAETAVKESERLWQTVFEASNDIILLLNDQYVILASNERALEAYNYSRQELIGMNLRDLHALETRGDVEFQLGEAVRKNGIVFETKQMRKDGKVFPVEVSSKPFFVNNRPRFIHAIRDITERKCAEELINKLSSAVEQTAEYVVITNREGVIEYVNPAIEKPTGYTKEEIIGKTPRIFKSGKHNEAFYKALWETILSGKAFRAVFTNRKRDGELYYEEETITPIKDSLGNITHFVSVGRDITKQKRAEERQATQFAVTRILADSATIGEAIPKLLQSICEGVGWELGELWCVDPEANLLRWNGIWHLPSLMAKEFEAVSRSITFSLGKGLPGRVWASGHPIWINDVVADTDFRRADIAAKTELHRAVAFPIRSGNKVIGVMVFFGQDIRQPDEDLLEMMADIGSQIGQFIERKRAEEALRESEERYALAARGANDGLWDWNLKTNEIYFSSRWKSMLGYRENEIGNSPEEWFKQVHPDDINRLKIEIDLHLKGTAPHLENEYRMLHKDGTYRWMLSRGLVVRDALEKASRVVGSQTDITERKITEVQLLHSAFYDELTNLPNRALFMDRLRLAVERSKRHENYLFAVLFLDLDRFKTINDSLGHIAGDRLLTTMARRLESCLRQGDTAARLGGDEFAILLDDIKDVSDATRVADRIQQELGLPFDLDGQEVFTTASVGITVGGSSRSPAQDGPVDCLYDRPEDLLRDADIAMYRAKALGKARYEMFDKSMHLRAMALLQLETDLRKAVERREFVLHYQPFVSLTSGRIIGFEALIYWQHPQRGLLSPMEFLLIAEETGLTVPIGEWVLRTACTQNKVWQDAGYPPLYVAVNLSDRQFKQKNLVETVVQVLKETNLDPHWLEMELTESIIMENAEMTISKLKELKELGVQLSIDDFGTGYSSLNYLKRFPIDTLKIDQSFVRDIPLDPDDTAIVTAVINLARSLKLNVIAEGVETEEQMTFLLRQECDKIQGYLFSRPVPSDGFKKLLQEGKKL
jgi:diguanylate cyclase (GGDEF)-like protein/PAS domain S-box-containing protein